MATITVTPTHVRALDDSVSRNYISNEAMNVGDLVQVSADGEVEMANSATAAGANYLIGMVTAGGRSNTSGAIIAGEAVTVTLHGAVYVGENANMDETKPLFVGAVDGDMVDLATANPRIVGWADSPSVLFINPQAVPAGS